MRNRKIERKKKTEKKRNREKEREIEKKRKRGRGGRMRLVNISSVHQCNRVCVCVFPCVCVWMDLFDSQTLETVV